MATEGLHIKLTDRELQLVVAAWQCLKTEPQLDYEKLAQVCNFKNKASAGACIRPVLKKLKDAYNPGLSLGGGDANEATAPCSPATAGKRKASGVMKTNVDSDIDNDNVDSEHSDHIETPPAKRPAKKTPAKKAPAKKAQAKKATATSKKENAVAKVEDIDQWVAQVDEQAEDDAGEV